MTQVLFAVTIEAKSIANGKALAKMRRMLQFIDHSYSIVLNGDLAMAVAVD